MTDEQNAVAARTLAAQAEMQIDVENTESAQQMKREARPKTTLEDANSKKVTEEKSVVGNFAKLWYGNDTEVKEAEDFLRSLNPDILEIDRDGDSVVVEFADGSKEIMSFTDDAGVQVDQASFIKGNVNKILSSKNKIVDVDATLAKSKFDNTREFNSTSVGFSAIETEGSKEPVQKAFERVIKLENPIPDGAIKIDDKNASVPGVQAFVNSLPGLSGNYTVSAGGWGTDDYIEIKDKDGKAIIKYENLDDQLAKYKEKLSEEEFNKFKKEIEDGDFNAKQFGKDIIVNQPVIDRNIALAPTKTSAQYAAVAPLEELFHLSVAERYKV